MFCHFSGQVKRESDAFLIKPQSIFRGFFFVSLAATLITFPADVKPAPWHSVWHLLTDTNLLLLLPTNSVTCRHDWHSCLSTALSSGAVPDWNSFFSGWKQRMIDACMKGGRMRLWLRDQLRGQKKKAKIQDGSPMLFYMQSFVRNLQFLTI